MKNFKGLVALLSATIFLLALATVGSAENVDEPWKKYDFGGETVKIYTHFGHVTPLGYRVANWYEPDARLEAHIAEVEEMFNAKIEFVSVPGSGITAWRNAAEMVRTGALAGDQPLHLLTVSETLPELALDGMLHPLDEILDQDFYDSYPPTFRTGGPTRGMQIAGVTYGFEVQNYMREASGIIWNMDLFERHGLPNIYELIENDEWTWDKFAEIAYAATMDTDGDGEIDQVGVSGRGGTRRWTKIWSDSNNIEYTKLNDGKVEAIVDPALIEALEFAQDLYNDGVLITTDERDGWAMRFAYIHEIQTSTFVDHPDRHGLAPLPKGPNATDYHYPMWNEWQGVVPIYVEEPRALIELASALWRTRAPYIEDLEYWEENYWERFSLAVHDRESLAIWQDAAKNAELPYDYLELFALDNAGWQNRVNSILDDGVNPAVAISEMLPIIQSLIDEPLGQ